jgi:hypothetical protein
MFWGAKGQKTCIAVLSNWHVINALTSNDKEQKRAKQDTAGKQNKTYFLATLAASLFCAAETRSLPLPACPSMP